jgi:predicted HicB family RNase H-like nuclease
MRDTKSFASLSSGLLARKGAAKPAMRPQGFGSFGSSLEDLGWNDMGQQDAAAFRTDAQQLHGAAGLTPSPVRTAPESDFEPVAETAPLPAAEPAVVTHRRALEQSFAPAEQPEETSESVTSAAAEVVSLKQRPRQAPARPQARAKIPALPAKAKAAFTLRLDPDRHLRLRLACAISHRSAQQLVTGALDEFLKSLPEVDAMAERLPVEASGR